MTEKSLFLLLLNILHINYYKLLFKYMLLLCLLVPVFSILLPCSGNNSGIASFSIRLLIQNRKGRALPDTPLKVKLRKECMVRGTSKSTSKKLLRLN